MKKRKKSKNRSNSINARVQKKTREALSTLVKIVKKNTNPKAFQIDVTGALMLWAKKQKVEVLRDIFNVLLNPDNQQLRNCQLTYNLEPPAMRALGKVTETMRKNVNPKCCKADTMECLLLWCMNQPEEKIEKIFSPLKIF